jgi:hypothetical protein
MQGVIFYYTVETGNLSGPATSSLQVTEATTGKVVLSTTNDITLPANSTNILGWTTILPDGDGYEGLEKVSFTTTLGTQTETELF